MGVRRIREAGALVQRVDLVIVDPAHRRMGRQTKIASNIEMRPAAGSSAAQICCRVLSGVGCARGRPSPCATIRPDILRGRGDGADARGPGCPCSEVRQAPSAVYS